MRKIGGAGLMLLGLAMAGPVRAQAPAAGISYDCDTAADHYSELVLPAPEGSFSITGKVQLMNVLGGKKFVTLTRIMLTSRSATPGRSAVESGGFTLSALTAGALGLRDLPKDRAVEYTTWLKPEGKSGEGEPQFVQSEEAPMPFALTYRGGMLDVALGEQKMTMPLEVKEPVLRIVCSTGEYLYSDLEMHPLTKDAEDSVPVK